MRGEGAAKWQECQIGHLLFFAGRLPRGFSQRRSLKPPVSCAAPAFSVCTTGRAELVGRRLSASRRTGRIGAVPTFRAPAERGRRIQPRFRRGLPPHLGEELSGEDHLPPLDLNVTFTTFAHHEALPAERGLHRASALREAGAEASSFLDTIRPAPAYKHSPLRGDCSEPQPPRSGAEASPSIPRHNLPPRTRDCSELRPPRSGAEASPSLYTTSSSLAGGGRERARGRGWRTMGVPAVSAGLLT